MMTRPASAPVAVLLAVLLLLPLAAAAPDALTARSVEARGDHRMAGPLVVLKTTVQGDATSSLWLDADHLTVEREAHGELYAPGGAPANSDAEVERWTGRNVTVHSASAGAQQEVFIVPLKTATVHVEDRHGSWTASGDEVVSEPDKVEVEGRTFKTPTAGALRATPAFADGVVTVVGDFLVVLWDTNVTATDAGGERTFSSGRFEDEGVGDYSAQGVGFQAPYTHVAADLLLFVQDGTLELHPGGTDLALHLASAHVTGGSFVARDATGTLPDRLGGGAVVEQSVGLEGALAMDLRPDGGDLEVRVGGDIAGATLDGRPLTIITPTGGGGGWTRLLLGGFGLATVAASTGTVQAQRNLAQRRLEDAELLFGAGHYAAAADAARPRALSGSVARQSAILHVQALLLAGRPTDARRALARHRAVLEPEMADLLDAYLLQASGDRRVSGALVDEMLRRHPDWAVVLGQDPVLGGAVAASGKPPEGFT